MEIQFAAEILDVHGKAVEEKEGTPLRLGRACEIALDSSLPRDREEGLSPKLKRGALIEKITKATDAIQPLALSAEDISLLKDRIGQVFTSASVVRNICKMLDETTE